MNKPDATSHDAAAAKGAEPQLVKAERDIVALGILAAAIILFVGTGSSVLTRITRSYLFGESNTDALLGNALILNIALIIFGWRRYKELSTEVGERRKAEETAQRLAQTDALTGCLNRRSLEPAIEKLVDIARASGGEVLVMMIDLDKFKRSNDLHGHKVGDEVLMETARRIRAQLPGHAVIARLGGDEFTCALALEPGVLTTEDPSAAENIVARINETIAMPIRTHDTTIEVTASIGLSRSMPIPEECDGRRLVQDLVHRADLAMYQAKKAGRNRYCWFEPSMEKELRFRSELEAGIREGLAKGEFVPFYEKQVDIDTGEITGFEMLARWQSPRHGLVGPEIFIPVAEEIGLISDLSEQLIARALRDARDWDPALTLSVNISPLQMRDPWFAQRILRLLVEANFPPHRLDIEITETCLHENIGVVRSMITSLRNQGIRISLDDFGTGYSSLSQLRTLPFDRIKIDRSFVSTLGRSKDSATIIEAISSLGRGMDLPITAEGIENREVLEALRQFGSFKGQGYLYGMPAAAEDVRRELGEKGLLAGTAPAQDDEGPAAVVNG
ncbi:putative bifunctional diguanylate cyclase/phosphodiesterase [Novosphingobium cyanobacteriorum]|uniref:EAL domain-containing protein n=1 Tax=Novosphingobium cyanobacteriorum TaxID=3024215 RepID=A0ABT6CLW2_9SPHN|nr:EAL domain-containing protein [Novosphingobium cyanobacteriorum]MDF8334842.1 EAL domain-containing protein [Novosphingobium cyanobacteriorum]